MHLTPIAGDPAAPDEKRRDFPKFIWVKTTHKAKTPDRLNEPLGRRVKENTMNIKEKEFEKELEAFRVNIETAAQFFYAFQTISYLSTEDKSILNILTQNRMFWNTNMGALRDAMFIALGRIFDRDNRNNPYNIFKLLEIAEDNSQLFKITSPRWAKIAKDTVNIYEPQSQDWRRLCSHVCKWNSVYREKYKPIRDKVMAHHDRISLDKKVKLFDETSYTEIEKLFAFFDAFYEALYNLYFNGSKPVIRYRRYSLVKMLTKRTAEQLDITAGERVVLDTQKFLESYVKRTRIDKCGPTPR